LSADGVIVSAAEKYLKTDQSLQVFFCPSAHSDVDPLAVAQSAFDCLKADNAIDEGEQSVIGTPSNIDTRHDGGSPLADQDGTSADSFTAIGLDTEPLGV
jgi:hypothetical protein